MASTTTPTRVEWLVCSSSSNSSGWSIHQFVRARCCGVSPPEVFVTSASSGGQRSAFHRLIDLAVEIPEALASSRLQLVSSRRVSSNRYPPVRCATRIAPFLLGDGRSIDVLACLLCGIEMLVPFEVADPVALGDHPRRSILGRGRPDRSSVDLPEFRDPEHTVSLASG